MPGFFIKSGKVGGAENQFYNLAVGLTYAGAKVTIVSPGSSHLSRDFIELADEITDVSIQYSGSKGSRFAAEQNFIFSDTSSADAIIYPNYFTPIVRGKSSLKIATIIHDCQYLNFPQFFPVHKRLWLRLAHKNTLARADKIIVLSHSVLDDIQKSYGSKHINKISVIGNPISWERFAQAPDNKINISGKYILSVAHHWAHKNLDTLIRAFNIVAEQEQEIKLVLVGQVVENLAARVSSVLDIKTIIEEMGLENRVIVTGFVNDMELGTLYRNATIFAFPSLFEGFGMPPVEAMGLAVPTITTRCTSLPEATLGLARYVENPKNENEWSRELLSVIRQPKFNGYYKEIANKVRSAYDLKHIGTQYLEAIFS